MLHSMQLICYNRKGFCYALKCNILVKDLEDKKKHGPLTKHNKYYWPN